jgi:hypothetical protein
MFTFLDTKSHSHTFYQTPSARTLKPTHLLHMYTHGFSPLSAFICIYIFYTSTIYIHVYHKNTTSVYLKHSHMQHFTPKHPPVHTHCTQGFHYLHDSTHLFIFLFHDSTHTLLFFCFSTPYMSTTHRSITHSHSPTYTFSS